MAAAVASSRSPGLQRAFGWGWPPLLLGVAVWCLVQVHRRVRSAVARWLLHPVLTVLLLASVAGGAGTVREALRTPADPSADRLVDVGGHRLHLRCRGSGSPTVVLEPGLGDASADLRWIEPTVAAGTRVCVYDRAGRALSDDVDQPQDAVRIATDLRTLLDRAGVRGPYVLAGHSFGGLYVLTFAARYPEQVAGLALLDSTSPAPGGPAASGPATTVDRLAALAPALGRVSVGRGPGSSAQEWLMGARSVQEAADLRDLQATPLLVLTAGSGHDATWFTAQRRLTTLSTNSLQRIAEDTTHESLVGDEHDAAAAARAVLDVVAAVRTSSPLRPA